MHFSTKSLLAVAAISTTLWVAAANAAAIPQIFGTGVATNNPADGKAHTFTAPGNADLHFVQAGPAPTQVLSSPLPGTWVSDSARSSGLLGNWTAPRASQSPGATGL